MVDFIFTVGSFGVRYERQKDAVRGRGHGDRKRRSLLRGRLPLEPGNHSKQTSAGGTSSAGRIDRLLSSMLIVIFAANALATARGGDPPRDNEPADNAVDSLTLVPPITSDSDRTDSPSLSASQLSVSEAQARASIQWLATLALHKMPRSFDGDKNWGDTKKVWAGVKVRLDGLKVKTHRRFRELEQGRWIKYEVTLPDPTAPEAATVTIHDVVPATDQASGEQRWMIYSSIVAPMKFTARIQRWNLGVKLFSMTVTGDMRVKLMSATSVGFVADYTEVPPALVLDPRVDQAQLVLEHFEVNRISHIGGDVAEQWGELIEEILVERFVNKHNDRLLVKLNKSIEKERDDLRLSMAEWFTSW